MEYQEMEYQEMEYQERCKGCVFLRFTWDKGGMPTIPICHGSTLPEKERIQATQNPECSMCEEGHELEKEFKERGSWGNVPASEMYKYDRSWYSETPVGYCGRIPIGVKPCSQGEGDYCYSRPGCTSQMSLGDHNRRSNCQANRDFSEAMRNIGIEVQ